MKTDINRVPSDLKPTSVSPNNEMNDILWLYNIIFNHIH